MIGVLDHTIADAAVRTVSVHDSNPKCVATGGELMDEPVLFVRLFPKCLLQFPEVGIIPCKFR